MLKIALIGTGNISKGHCKAYDKIEGVKIIAVADIDKVRAEETGARFGANVYTSIDELLEAEKPDMVDICTPTYTHAELAIKALNKRVHVLCEKPMALDIASARAMYEASKNNGVFLMIAQILRFWPEYGYLKRIYRDGTYGRLLEAHFKRIGQTPGPNSWFSKLDKSGLSPLDLHVHDADFILDMLGKPQGVVSFGIPDDEKNNYIATRYLYDGIVVEAEAGFFDPPVPFEMSYRAVFEKAAVYYQGEKLTIYPCEGQPQVVEPENMLIQETGVNITTKDGFFNEISYFISCIKSGSYPSVSAPESTLESLNMVMHEVESARTGKTIMLGAL